MPDNAGSLEHSKERPATPLLCKFSLAPWLIIASRGTLSSQLRAVYILRPYFTVIKLLAANLRSLLYHFLVDPGRLFAHALSSFNFQFSMILGNVAIPGQHYNGEYLIYILCSPRSGVYLLSKHPIHKLKYYLQTWYTPSYTDAACVLFRAAQFTIMRLLPRIDPLRSILENFLLTSVIFIFNWLIPNSNNLGHTQARGICTIFMHLSAKFFPNFIFGTIQLWPYKFAFICDILSIKSCGPSCCSYPTSLSRFDGCARSTNIYVSRMLHGGDTKAQYSCI
jgi:hypothetical protein